MPRDPGTPVFFRRALRIPDATALRWKTYRRPLPSWPWKIPAEQAAAAEATAAAEQAAAAAAAIAHAKSLGFTDEMIAAMYPNLVVP